MKTEVSAENKDTDLNENQKKDKITYGNKIGIIVFGILFFLAVAVITVSIWYKRNFSLRFNNFLFTLLSPMSGSGRKTTIDILNFTLLPGFISIIPYCVFILLTRKRKPLHLLLRKIGAAVICISLFFSLVYCFLVLRIPEFLKYYTEKTSIYEERYIDPENVAVTDNDGNAHNLIYIYLESIETTYASKEEGGSQNGVNYIPNLTNMAKENISFSDGNDLGGFRSVNGTAWTMGALLGTTSGVPFALEIFECNSQGDDSEFLNGLTTLGDILEEKGYKNSFLIGSDSEFANADSYLTSHGNYEMADLYTARGLGYISKNYHNGFWGFEDKYLYEIAKDKLTELAKGDEPFNFTMMTIDTHHTGGYLCSLCTNEYPDKLGNVISCADKQLYEFIEWCKQQSFYENTTIIITGDHPRMDNYLVKGVPFYERTVYNCILNAAIDAPQNDKNRVFTSLDMFPTTLAAMGFEIEGDRLGLGTNLFSNTPTLCEELGDGKKGYDVLDTELEKKTDYYKNNFVK